MINKHLGYSLKKIRKMKGYTISDIATNDLSKSLISKFENGQTSISIDRFRLILKRLRITYEEFLFFSEIEDPSPVDFWRRLKKSCDDSISLKKLKNEVRNDNLLLSVIDIVKNETLADQSSIQTVMEYLFQQNTWAYFEMSLFNNCFHSFPFEFVQVQTNTIIKSFLTFDNKFSVAHNEIIKLLLNLSLYYCEHEEKKVAKYFIDETTKLLEKTDWLYEANKCNFIKGIWEITFNNRNKGIELCENSINIMSILPSTKLHTQHKEYLEKLLKPGLFI